MPPLMRTSKESPCGDVCAAQTHGVISTAETISTAAKARNLHRLIILLCSPFAVAYWTARPQPKFAVDSRSTFTAGAYDDKASNALLHGPSRAIEGPDAIFGRHNRARSVRGASGLDLTHICGHQVNSPAASSLPLPCRKRWIRRPP